MAENRVVVTGLGVISPIGVGLEAFWKALLEGKNGVSKISRFDLDGYRSHMAAEVNDFEPADFIEKKSIPRLDRCNHFSLSSAIMAYDDAGLNGYKFDRNRAGVIIGSGIGGASTINDGFLALLDRGPKAISPFFISKVLINMSASIVSIHLGFKGPMAAPSVACSTGGNAIGEAFRMLQRGDADLMLAGSAEAAIYPLVYAGFCATRSMSTRNDAVEKASRPFDKDRDGFVMGEGAGLVILETLEHARKRGARIYGELIGYGNTADAFHYTAPHPEGDGMVRVMQQAFADSKIEASDVQHINAHGTSTVLNDQTECKAIRKVFGNRFNGLKVTSIKSMIGHLLSAAGSVEFISTIMSVFKGIIPPTINFENADETCPVNLVNNKAVAMPELEIAASNNFGFGGGNACLVIRKFIDY